MLMGRRTAPKQALLGNSLLSLRTLWMVALTCIYFHQVNVIAVSLRMNWSFYLDFGYSSAGFAGGRASLQVPECSA